MFGRVAESTQAKSLRLLDFVGLNVHAHQLAGKLSYGKRKLLENVMALMSEPKMLMLDERTAGVSGPCRTSRQAPSGYCKGTHAAAASSSVDEPSIGLEPRYVEDVFGTLLRLKETEDLSILMAEQNILKALDFADFVHVLSGGRLRWPPDQESWTQTPCARPSWAANR
jgi:ABC-type branched-subunit amino acid transport system ATPase component